MTKNIIFKHSLFTIVLVFLVSFLYLSFGFNVDIHKGYFDEGLTIYGAARILNGDVPYRDFWTLYAPGEFYLLALAFRIFNISIVTERILTIFVLSLIALSTYLFAIRIMPYSFSISTWLLTIAWLKTDLSYSCPVHPALLFSILTGICLANFVDSMKKYWIFLSGLSTAITFIFRQDFGFYVFISGLMFITTFALKGKYLKTKNIDQINLLIRYIIQYLSSFVLIISLCILYFVFNFGLKDLIYDTIIFPITVYPKFRKLPYPLLTIRTLIFYLPILVLLTTIVSFLTNRLKNILFEKKILIFFILLLEISFFNHAILRPDTRHLFPIIVTTILLFSFLLAGFFEYLAKKKFFWLISYFVIFCIMLIPHTQFFLNLKYLYNSKLTLKRAAGCYDNLHFIQSQQAAVNFIQEVTKADEKIFVGNSRHDIIINNDIMFYFLSERHSATKYHELHPGLATTREIQDYIISDIIKHRVKYIVLFADTEELYEPNESSKSSGITNLDSFIRRNYIPVKIFGSYKILKNIYEF